MMSRDVPALGALALLQAVLLIGALFMGRQLERGSQFAKVLALAPDQADLLAAVRGLDSAAMRYTIATMGKCRLSPR